jgi:cobalt-zinc-cadmium efflux system outer membrane protein
MRFTRGRTAVRVFACILVFPVCPAEAQDPLTLEQVLHLARDRAPLVAVARARVAEAEARLAGTRLRLQDNPRLDLAAGPRSGGGTDLDVGVEQQFEPAGSRSARIAAAQAAVDRERAASEVVVRTSLRDAATAFVTLLQREREIGVLEAAQAVTRDVLRSVERRHELGDIAILDVNVARAAAARVRSDLRSAMAARLAAAGDLAAVLGIPGTAAIVTGDLRVPTLPAVRQLEAAAATRPELVALEAERREAQAEISLGEAQRRVRLGAAARYEREEGDQIVLGGLTVTLPAFNTGQELRLAGAARARRVDLELAAARGAADTRVAAAAAALEQEVAAVESLEREALPQLEENESLARRSYEAGQISLADWLVIRRELFDTRREYLEKLRNAAVARIELDAIAGVLR